MRALGRLLLALLLLPVAARAQAEGPLLLDIYFEENHAGSFYHFAESLPLEEPHTLVLIDAHNDASAIAGSEQIREALRKAASREALAETFARWRKTGAVQCFDWIEPLMPRPFERVLWVAGTELNPLELGRAQTLARENLDGLLEAFPRAAGELGPRFAVTDLARLEHGACDARHPVVASIDLDFFANASDVAADFRRVWKAVLRLPRLRAVTFSVSTPWLRDRAQADQLVALAVEASAQIANARVRIVDDVPAGRDRSRRAQELRKAGRDVPAFQFRAAAPSLRTLLVAKRSRVQVDAALGEQIAAWWRDPFLPVASVRGEVPDPDGWHRLAAGEVHEFSVAEAAGGQVRWYVEAPTAASTNVAGLKLGFAEGAPRFLQREPRLIGETALLASSALKPFLEPVTGAGTAVVFATVERDGEVWRSNDLRIAFRASTGFRRALSEYFARPYAFGCGLVPGGPDALLGNDCANFLISGLRREGWRLPWGSPKQFAEHLESLGAWKTGDGPLAFDAARMADGLFVHFGSHVGAVWDDRPPAGQLDPGDLIAHHLEGFPEIVPLAKLTRSRNAFRLMRKKSAPENARLTFGGDVMLGRGVGEAIARGRNPLGKITRHLASADWAVVNLECVASELGSPAPGKRYHFRAPVSTPELLSVAGIDAVSLANNHHADFGPAAHADACQRLRANGLAVLARDTKPLRVTARGVEFDVFACEDEAPAGLLTAVRSSEAIPIVLVHWGDEHRTTVSERQRAMADQLITAGAQLIVGSGPHRRQPLEFRRGALVAWSLGNLVFDGPGPDAEWSRGTLLDVEFSPEGRIVRAKGVGARVADDGEVSLDE